MTKKCDSCIHNSICMYKEKYKKVFNEFQKATQYEFPINIEIGCHQYLKDNDYTYQKEDIVDIKELKFDTNPLHNIIKTSNSYDKGVENYLKKVSGEYNSIQCPYCGSNNIQYMYGRLNLDSSGQISHYICKDCHEEFNV